MLQIEGERELPEVSRRDLDLLIAEEEEAILLEERRKGRPPRQPMAHPALDSQTPGTGSLGFGSALISSFLSSEL